MSPVQQRAGWGMGARRGAFTTAALLRLASGAAQGLGRVGGATPVAAAAAAPAPSALAAAEGLRTREALLKEARERLTTWYEDKSTLDLPFWRDEAQIQMSKGECLCDGPGKSGKVPLTFGQFDVTGARPVDVFNVLADSDRQTEWDPTVSQVKEITGEWPQTDGVRALEMLYPTGIIMVPPREVFEWVAYSADFDAQEFWVVYSTLNNQRLHQAFPRAENSVAAQNCLGAYWIRAKPGGGAHVIFTQHVNPHPPMMLSAKLVFTVSWGKQIDYIDILRQQAAKQFKQSWAANRTVLSKELLRGPAPGERLAAPATSEGNSFRVIDAGFVRLFQDARPWTATPGRGPWVAPAVMATLCGGSLAAAAAAIVAAGRRRRSAPSARRAAAPRTGGAAEAVEAAALLEEAAADERGQA